MDAFSIGWNLSLVVFFTLLNGFFVAAEFAMVKVRQTRLQQLALEGNAMARTAQQVTGHLDAYLSACQLGITLASLALGALGEPAIARLIEPGLATLGVPSAVVHTIAFAIAFTIITFLHIVFGELAPKSLAIRKAEETTLWTATPLKGFYVLFYPAIWALNGVANATLKLLGIEPVSEHEAAHTEEEIRILMNESAKSGHIDQTEMALFEKIFHFSDRLAREVMVPRVDIICLDRNDPFEENLETALHEEHTRYPVCDGSKDNVVGFVHIKDLYQNEDRNLDSITRQILAVPGSVEISAVLKQMQKAKTHMAIVMDEYGGTAGMVTIEDILEELVGEIQDEFDVERPAIEQKGEIYSLDGRLLLQEVNETFGLNIEAEEDSIGGWLYSQLGHDPVVGEFAEVDNARFTVAEVDHLRITRVTFERIVTTPSEEALQEPPPS